MIHTHTPLGGDGAAAATAEGGRNGETAVALPWQEFDRQQQQQQQLAASMTQQQQQLRAAARARGNTNNHATTAANIAGGGGGDPLPQGTAAWREREQNQRSVRVLMMFLLMLLLMDEDAATSNEETDRRGGRLRHGSNNNSDQQQKRRRHLDPDVFASRQVQEDRLRRISQNHERYTSLVHEKNRGVDYSEWIAKWAREGGGASLLSRDEFLFEPQELSRSVTSFVDVPPPPPNSETEKVLDPTQRVWHYPWNTTGFYRGDWHRVTEIDELVEAATLRRPPNSPNSNSSFSNNAGEDDGARKLMVQTNRPLSYHAAQMEDVMIDELQYRNQWAAVLPLPFGYQLVEPRERNKSNETILKVSNKLNDPSLDATPEEEHVASVTLTRDDGRAAFQLFSKPIAGMAELSLVTGFVKLYDSNAAGYSTRKDILLRVYGVLIHSMGRLSLVANAPINSVALVMDEPNHVLTQTSVGARTNVTKWMVQPSKHEDSVPAPVHLYRRLQHAMVVEKISTEFVLDRPRNANLYTDGTPSNDTSGRNALTEVHWSNNVIPYPFIKDDEDGSLRNAPTPASRAMPEREHALEANSLGCIFEMNFDVSPVEWTIGEWRKLVGRRVDEAHALNPAGALQKGKGKTSGGIGSTLSVDSEDPSDNRHRKIMKHRRTTKKLSDQALAMNLIGTIHSRNCNFTAFLNTTALRTDWDATTSKAINYSFYMMIVCLTQILILLRQLLHSQAQATATRVSLLCIGWQTVIDAIMCLAHIYLSLAVQPLFTTFASVAFFKLLIFCVIEMKYMAIIVQARTSSNGGISVDALRHQVAMLHLRFYGSLMVAFLLLFYAQNNCRVFYMLGLYSFWVPQIILNIVTEAKSPLHKYYIYGMSITRIVAPLYIFGLRKNFLKEVYPESSTDPFMCQMLVLWVACQTVVLIAQGKYGARFMIPARFLPPKFDYRRPIPASMLPPGALVNFPSPEQMEDRDDGLRSSTPPMKKHEVSDDDDILSSSHESQQRTMPPLRHQTAETTRNRLKGKQQQNGGVGHISSRSGNPTSMTTEDLTQRPPAAAPAPAPVLECSICYDDIDVRNRQQYMLAPCNHLFHADCLKQWMDVKLECPICRTQLPPL